MLFPIFTLLCGAQGWGAAWSRGELSAVTTAKDEIPLHGSPVSALVPTAEFLSNSAGRIYILWLLCFSGCYF